jgi:hypothetical protein
MLLKTKKYRVSLFLISLVLPLSFAKAMPSNMCSHVFLKDAPLEVDFVLYQHEFGEIVKYSANKSLVGPLKETLRIGTYNVLNLYEHTPRKDKVYPLEKDHSRRLGNAKSIHDIDPDFQVLVEVENYQAAESFNRDYLGNRYKILLLQGNDRGNINIALLVKQDLPIDVEYRSYRGFKQHIFSRDLPVGLVYERDAQGVASTKPKFALLGTHYKSKRTHEGQADTSSDKRRQQVVATIEIVELLQKEFGADLPIVLAGDFNSGLHNSPEFQGLFKQGFKDTLDALPLSPEDRATHYYFARDNAPVDANQIDGILTLSPNVEVLAGRVIPDRNAEGQTLEAPKDFNEREDRPSDHRPIGVEIKVK